MVSERPPIFVPSGKGFKASYALTFSSDLQHHIYLGGMIQGDSIEAKTLSVDNTANGTPCTVTLRGDSKPVAPFTLAYIDCSNALDVVITGGASSATVAVDVLTYTVQEQTIVKKVANVGGLPPIVVFGSGSLSYNTATKIVSIGAGVTTYVTLTNLSTSAGPMNFGFTNATNMGQISVGGQLQIPMDSAINELWINHFSGFGTYDNYSFIGG